MARLRHISATLCLALVPMALTIAMAGGTAVAVPPCSRGQVALTFDDGPDPTLTPRFVSLLRDRRVPATFFVVGEKVRAHPGPVRRASALGFTIGNHTYRHENLTRLSGEAVRTTLRRTRRAIVAAGVRPSALMRPPYGSIDDRVRTVARGVGLVPLLWTVDPRDWAGRSASTITGSTLAQLRPGKGNVVVLHDGVGNSRQTLLALPGIIRGARARGYCFVGLGAAGAPTSTVPRVRISDAVVSERVGGSLLRATVALDRAASRETSVRVRTIAGTATAGRDFVAVDARVDFPAGVTRRTVRVRVRDDVRDETAERFTIRLSGAWGLEIGDGVGVGTIRDDDPPPLLVVRDASVTEPDSGEVTVPVVLRLDRPSERWVHVTLSTSPGTAGPDDYTTRSAQVTLAPGQVRKEFAVAVLADTDAEGPETFDVRATEGIHVTLGDPTGTVTILPPGE